MLKDAAYEGRDVLTPAQLQLHRLPLFILRLDDDVSGALQAAACICIRLTQFSTELTYEAD